MGAAYWLNNTKKVSWHREMSPLEPRSKLFQFHINRKSDIIFIFRKPLIIIMSQISWRGEQLNEMGLIKPRVGTPNDASFLSRKLLVSFMKLFSSNSNFDCPNFYDCLIQEFEMGFLNVISPKTTESRRS